MTLIMDTLYFLDHIERRGEDGYEIVSHVAREYFGALLYRNGFSLRRLATHRELLDAISTANAAEFTALLAKPAPVPALRFLWERLRKLGR